MSSTLKVRDRSTNKVKEALVDHEDYERLKGYNYIIDKTMPEPFRELSQDGKRLRIALKRDVMQIVYGDPQRVCYVNKNNTLDCRKSNLKTKESEDKVVKLEKKGKSKKTKTEKTVAPEVVKTPVFETPVFEVVQQPVAAVVAEPVLTSTLVTPDKPTTGTDSIEVKKTLLNEVDLDYLANHISMDILLAAWAESRGYRKQA